MGLPRPVMGLLYCNVNGTFLSHSCSSEDVQIEHKYLNIALQSASLNLTADLYKYLTPELFKSMLYRAKAEASGRAV
jgi:hypothetical protein